MRAFKNIQAFLIRVMGDNRLPREEAFVYEGCLTHTLVKEAQCRDLKLEGEAYSALCDSRPVTLGARLSVCDLSLIRALVAALGATSQAPPTIALSQFPLLTVYDTIMDLVSAPPAVEALLLFVEVQSLAGSAPSSDTPAAYATFTLDVLSALERLEVLAEPNAVLNSLIRGASILGEAEQFISNGVRLVVKRHIRALELAHPHSPRRAPPMQYDHLILIERRLKPLVSFADLMALLLIRACFENGIRAGEALRMRIGGIKVLSGTRIEVKISHSKTSQGRPVIYHYHDTGEEYCFIRLLQIYQHLYHEVWLISENYLFVSYSLVGSSSRSRSILDASKPLTTSWLSNVLKELSLELDFCDILRCHSLRSGFACALLLAGISLPEIQKLGRWSSDTYLIYLRDSLFVSHMRDPLIQKMVEVGIGVRSENHGGGMRFSAKKWEVPEELSL